MVKRLQSVTLVVVINSAGKNLCFTIISSLFKYFISHILKYSKTNSLYKWSSIHFITDQQKVSKSKLIGRKQGNFSGNFEKIDILFILFIRTDYYCKHWAKLVKNSLRNNGFENYFFFTWAIPSPLNINLQFSGLISFIISKITFPDDYFFQIIHFKQRVIIFTLTI